ncbi:MAG: hypothetical protein WD018_04615 [Nitrosopumilaceae archaeon]
MVIPSLVYAESEVELTLTPKEIKYWDDITIRASLSSYDKPDELRYYIDVFDPDGALFDSTLWFARQDHISVMPTENLVYKFIKTGEYKVVIEKAHTIERTGEIITSDSFTLTTYPPPKKQTQLGIPSDSINCNEGLELIFKSTDDTPACIKPSSYNHLVEIGWAQ